MKEISIKKGFASDNNSGVSHEVIEKIVEVNQGHVVGYGDDPYTEYAISLFKKHFGNRANPFFVFTGTAANVLGITGTTQSYNSVICAHTAHINEDECGAPERFSGCKLIACDTQNGKLTPELIKPHMIGFDFEHHSQPKIISITQPTEMGTVYSVDEIKMLSAFAKKYNMLLHMDGARLANAAVSLDLPFKDFTADAGVDILSFGGTKNGLLTAESIVYFKPELTEGFKYIRKQGMQLASKMRYMSAQFIAYLENDLWKRNASHANKMAQLLYNQIKNIKEIEVTQKVEANGIFVRIPKKIIEPLKEKFFFYNWNLETEEVRWMCSFDTTEQEINSFVKILKSLL
jgi:threonine aldolase